MSRNAAVVRQWNVLRALDASHYGCGIDELADHEQVTTRTIRRDLEALQEAGFALVCARVDGHARWKLAHDPFRQLLEQGLTLTEACALYTGRALLEGLAGTPFASDIETAYAKIERVLPPRIREFLERLPSVVAVPSAARRGAPSKQGRAEVATLVLASLEHRRVSMRYHSLSRDRVKDYVVEPCRVVYSHGALYLLAFVPAYGEIRTFAVERIKRLALLEETFTPTETVESDPFRHSMGPFRGGPAAHVVLDFDARIAPVVRARRWHGSQRTHDLADGRVRLELDVCSDPALRAWILGFGALVRVVAPASLATDIYEELEAARVNYAPRLDFELAGFPKRQSPEAFLPLFGTGVVS